jgi:hypothetical protein
MQANAWPFRVSVPRFCSACGWEVARGSRNGARLPPRLATSPSRNRVYAGFGHLIKGIEIASGRFRSGAEGTCPVRRGGGQGARGLPFSRFLIRHRPEIVEPKPGRQSAQTVWPVYSLRLGRRERRRSRRSLAVRRCGPSGVRDPALGLQIRPHGPENVGRLRPRRADAVRGEGSSLGELQGCTSIRHREPDSGLPPRH